MTLTKEEQLQNDIRFQELCDRYAKTHSKSDWDNMWMIVQTAAEATVKTMIKGVRCPDIDEIILDTTMSAMERIKKEIDTTGHFTLNYKLVTFLRSYALWPLYRKDKQFNDRAISFEDYLTNHADTFTYEGALDENITL